MGKPNQTKQITKPKQTKTKCKAWIGMVNVMNHKKTRNIWRWKSGSAAPYRNWLQSEKNTNNTNGQCVVLLESEDGNKWQKVDCKEKHMFWCDDRKVPKPGSGFVYKQGKVKMLKKTKF